MDIVHVKITFEDTFSKALLIKTATVSNYTWIKMCLGVGQIIRAYEDKTLFNWKVIRVQRI